MSNRTPDPDVIETLRQWAPKGTRIYTVLRSVARTGMSREIGVVVYDPTEGNFRHIDSMTAHIVGLPLGKRDGVRVPGCGMDLGFWLVAELAQAIHGDERALTHSWL